MSDWKPASYNSVSPYIITPNVEGLISFLKQTFDATDLRMHKDPKGRTAHAEVRILDSVLMLGDAGDGSQVPSHIHIYVPNVDEVFQRGIKAGGKSVQEPMQKEDQDKRGGLEDPFGAATWWVSTQMST